MSDPWDTAGYIASSRYRASVCELLAAGGPELPSRIATKLELAQPHVSRALSELRDRGVVELLVPESKQKGRLYGLTPEGEAALDRLQGETASVSVSFVDADAFPHPALLDYLRTEHGDAFRLALARDGDDSVAFAAAEVDEAFDERSLSSVVAALRASDAAMRGDGGDLPTGRSRFAVRGFERALLIRFPAGSASSDSPLPSDDEAEVYVSLDPEADVALRSFVESCRGRLH